MVEEIKVKFIESKDVNKLIYNKRKRLKKYKEIKTDDDLDRPKRFPVLKKILSTIYTVFLVCVFLVSGVFCTATIYGMLNGRPTSIFGCSFMAIASESMTNSGYEVGDVISVCAVNTKTLKEGDIIAFYLDRKIDDDFSTRNSMIIKNTDELEYANAFKNFFGVSNPDMNDASKRGCRRVFHQITKVYEDKNGVRWFVTKGTSNNIEDRWYVKETLVIGTYRSTPMIDFLTNFLQTISSTQGLIVCVLLPLSFIFIVQFYDFVRFFRLAIIEYQMIIGKRRPDDKICVSYNMGFRVSEKDKYRVLSNALEDEELYYCNYLWYDIEKLNKHKKFTLKRKLMTDYYKSLEELTIKCNDMYKQGEKFDKINKFYKTEKKKIEKHQSMLNKKLKKLKQHIEYVNAIEDIK